MKHVKYSKSDLVCNFIQAILLISLLIISYQEITHASQLTAKPNFPNVVPQIISDDPNFDMTSVELFKYHNNVILNSGTGPVEINGKTINPGSTDSVLITNEEIINIITSGGAYMVQSKENIQQTLTIQKIVSMSGDEVKISSLQRVIGFRITINDDFASQLDWAISGPVTYKKVRNTENQIILDVTLNAFASESDFDKYARPNSEGVYSSVFNITVRDKFAPFTSTEKGTYTYTEW